MSQLKTTVLIDARYASKLAQKLGKGRQTLDYEGLLSVLSEQRGCNIVVSYYFAPASEKDDAANQEKRDNYHKQLSVLPPNGPGLLVREMANRAENCCCPSCSKHFQVEVQNAIDVMLVTQAMKAAYLGTSDCIAVFAPDGPIVRSLKFVQEQLKKPIVVIGMKSDCPELEAISNKQLWLNEVWEFVSLTKKGFTQKFKPKIPIAIVDKSNAGKTTPDPDNFEELLVKYQEQDLNQDAVIADSKKSTFLRNMELQDYGILMAEERRRRLKQGMISIEQEIEDRRMALKLQAEENARAKGK
jgi:hypothetical protein